MKRGRLVNMTEEQLQEERKATRELLAGRRLSYKARNDRRKYLESLNREIYTRQARKAGKAEQ